MTCSHRPITAEELKEIQHEAFVLGQAVGMLLKYGYTNQAVELYNRAGEIFLKQAQEKLEGQDG